MAFKNLPCSQPSRIQLAFSNEALARIVNEISQGAYARQLGAPVREEFV